MISTSTSVSCSQIFIAIFQTLSDGCLMVIDPICRNADESITFLAIYQAGTGVCYVRAAIISSGVSNSDRIVNGTHACLAISSSHAIPKILSN